MVGLLLLGFVAQAAIAAVRDSVTIDEFVGLPVGLYSLEHVDFSSESMNPPFFRCFAVIPLWLAGVQAPASDGHWAMGLDFMRAHAGAYQQMVVPARCMVIFAAAALGFLVFRWATGLYGWQSGLVATFLYALSPTLLTFAHLVTLDASGTIGWVVAVYLTWRLVESPTVTGAVALGIALGISPALKLSGLVVPVVTAVVVAIRAATEREVPPRRWLALLAIAAATALVTLNALYRFDGTGAALGSMTFASPRMHALAEQMPALRSPLPAPFLRSLDVLFVGDEPAEPAYFLAGRWSMRGWWYYHLVAFALKTPLALVGTSALALVAWALRRSPARRDYCVFVPALAIFVANALLNPLNIGVRHALPAYPLLMIAASPWLARGLQGLASAERRPSELARGLLAASLLAWLTLANASVAPRYIQYFNELTGGPEHGHEWLIDSNLDWGQDLLRLDAYMRGRGLDSVHLAYFGRIDPWAYGIRYTPLLEGRSHGTAVVSASLLMGRPYWLWTEPGRLTWSRNGAFAWLRHYTPVGRIGSMFVFELP